MASPALLDIAALLQPIAGAQPTGDDSRLDGSPLSLYQAIKSARSSARDAEKNNLYRESGSNDADEHWRKIITDAPTLLKEKSKDLEVATWLTEALTRRYGFQGIRDSLALIEGLILEYWDNLYPLPDEDGIETRVAPLAGLNGASSEGVLIAPIRRITFTEGYTPGPFAFYQYQQAVELERTTNEDNKAEKAEKLGFTLELIEQAVNATNPEFFVDQLDDINLAIETCRRIENHLENRCGADEAPSMRAIVNALAECSGTINHIAKHHLPVAAPAAQEQSEEQPAISAEAVNSSTESNLKPAPKPDVITREDAFGQLLELAQFFKKTEPHSPVSYALEQAVKWGNMPLEELVLELIPDAAARKHFSLLTGVKSLED